MYINICIQICAIPLSWCQTVSDGWVMAECTLATTVGGEAWGVSLRVSGSRFATGTHFIKLIIGIYPDASARSHVIMLSSYIIICVFMKVQVQNTKIITNMNLIVDQDIFHYSIKKILLVTRWVKYSNKWSKEAGREAPDWHTKARTRPPVCILFCFCSKYHRRLLPIRGHLFG